MPDMSVEEQRQVIAIATALDNSPMVVTLMGDKLTWQTVLGIAKELYNDGVRGDVETEWEYNIEATDSKTGIVSLYRERWDSDWEWLQRNLDELNDLVGGWYTYRLVKRRKAGEAEDA